jgi:hypothetical protein
MNRALAPYIMGAMLWVACGSEDGKDSNAGTGGSAGSSAGPAGIAGAAGADTAGMAAAGMPPMDTEIRCGSFLTASEAASIGITDWLEAAVHDEAKEAAVCSDSVSIFPGAPIDSLISTVASSSEYEVVQGPMLGSRAHWFTFYSQPSVLLASTSMRYTAWITADDQPTLEAWAKALLPHLDAR